MKKDNAIVLTGIPRSGTTLVCYLLNTLPGVVALDEPMDVRATFRTSDHDQIRKRISHFFLDMRNSIQIHKRAISKNVKGRVTDNHGGAYDEQSGARTFKGSRGEIAVEKELGDDFSLLIKHPFQFTAMIETLADHFPVFAIIRNPLAVLASWNSVTFPVRRGSNPFAKTLAPALAVRLEGIKDRIERQLCYLSWYYERYLAILPEHSIIRYEDIIASGGKALKTIVPQAEGLNEPLENQNLNKLYDCDLVLSLAQRLVKTDGFFWRFYSRESVAEIATQFEGSRFSPSTVKSFLGNRTIL